MPITLLLGALKHWKFAAIGLMAVALWVQSSRLDHAKRDLTNARAETAQEAQGRQQAVAALELASEASTAAYGALEASCRAERAYAVRAGRTIARIVDAPFFSADAVRGIIRADQLRDVIGEDAPATGRAAVSGQPDGRPVHPAENP